MAKPNYQRIKEWRTKFPEKRKAQARRYSERHREKILAYQRAWRAENIELVRAQDAANARKWRKTNPEAQRERMRRFKAKAEMRLIEIAGRPRSESCELCGKEAKTVFDHNHKTGKFRGWLCQRCNRTLGQVKDNTELLRKMMLYLKQDGFYGSSYIRQTEGASQKSIRFPGSSAEIRQLPN